MVDRVVPFFEEQRAVQLIVEAISDYAVYMLDCSGYVVSWNRGAELNKGYASSEILGKHFKMFFTPEESSAGAPELELLIAKEQGRFAGEGWRVHKSGARFWASFSLTAVRDNTGHLLGFVKIAKDLSDRKRHEDALLAMDAALREERDRLQEERDRFHAAAESSLDALYLCEAVRSSCGEIEDFIFTYLNSNVEKMVSLPRTAMLGRRMCELFPVNRTSGLFERYKEVVLTSKPLVHEFQLQDRDVVSSWIRIQVVKLRDGIAITASDISARKADEERILHMAQHDALTGLPNRSVMEDRIGQAVKRARRYGGRMAVLLIDVDNFKHINDTFGHRTGDSVLCTVAARIRASLRDTDSLIRVGGDEFVVVVPELTYQHDLNRLQRKLLKNVREWQSIDSQTVQVTCSIGAAFYPDHGTSPDALISAADNAMYAAKRGGKIKQAL